MEGVRCSADTQNFGWVGHSAFGPTNNWPVCSLILRKISRIGATRRQKGERVAPPMGVRAYFF